MSKSLTEHELIRFDESPSSNVQTFARRFFTLVLAVLIPLTAVSAAESDQRVSMGRRYGNGYVIELIDEADRQVVFLQGEILPFKSKKGVDETLSMLLPGKNVDLIVSGSKGGEAAVFESIGKRIRERCPANSCRFRTYVNSECTSACHRLFMMGDERICAPGAIFGFHRKWIGSGQVQVVIQGKGALKDSYVRRGADEKWFADNIAGLTVNQKGAVYARSDSMIRAGVVHRIDTEFVDGAVTVLFPPDYFDARLPDGGSWLREVYDRPGNGLSN